MAAIEPSRRVSMGWVLGLSKKGPFKDAKPQSPPRPPKPNEYVKMMTTPGAVLEWAASDGRRNALTGKGKTRLTTALASVPAPLKDAEVKASPQKAPSEGGFGDMFGMFAGDDADNNATKGSDKTKDEKNNKNKKGGPSNKLGFTEAEDAKILELKSSDPSISWIDVGKELGKEPGKVKGRWHQIKPKDGKVPNQGAGGGGGGGKKDKGEGGQSGGKKEEISGDATNNWGGGADWGGAESGGDNKNGNGSTGGAWESGNWGGATGGDNKKGGGTNWGGDWGGDLGVDKKEGGDVGIGGTDLGWGGFGGTGDNSGGAADTWDQNNDNASKKSGASKAGIKAGDGWNNSGGGDTSWGASGGDSWGNSDDKGGATNTFGTGWGNEGKENKGSNDNVGGDWNSGNNAWGGQSTSNKHASKAGSTKQPSNNKDKNNAPRSRDDSKKSNHHHHSHSGNKSGSAAPSDIRLYPDDTFSTSDLKQIARILHQDRALLWERLAHRFADKTKRRLPPEVFERKLRRDAEREKKRAG